MDDWVGLESKATDVIARLMRPLIDVRHEKVAPFLRVRIPPGDFCSRRKQPEQSWR
jgi:hypothetical protein